VGGAGPAVNAYFHYFPFLPDDAPSPTSSSSSPASRTASLHRRAPPRPVATEVRTPVSPLLWTPRPSSRGTMPAAPCQAKPVSITPPCTRTPALAFACTSRAPLTRKGYPRQHHRRAVVAAPAPAPTTPRPPTPLVRDPSSQQP
jgi:hypothetical protein